VQVFDQSSEGAGLQLHLQLAFPPKLVKKAGAPAVAWLVLQAAGAGAGSGADAATGADARLRVTLVWQNKTATRLPEAFWLRFTPGAGVCVWGGGLVVL
jgi:hypothetical protein